MSKPIIKHAGTDIEREGCIGGGLRFSAAQKRLQGNWFQLDSTTNQNPYYNYDSNQFAFELLLGRLSEVSLTVGVGLRAGYNNYDLTVYDDNTLYLNDSNKFSQFLSYTAYLDLQTLFWGWAIDIDDWPLSPFYFMFSIEKTIRNSVEVEYLDSSLNNTSIDFRTSTVTSTIELLINF